MSLNLLGFSASGEAVISRLGRARWWQVATRGLRVASALLAACAATVSCFHSEAIPIGANGAGVSKPVLKAKLAPQSVPEDKNVAAGMTSDAKHFMLAANDDVRIDIQSFDFTITDMRNPGTPPAHCSPYAQGTRPGSTLPCDGWLDRTFLPNVGYKIRVYACPNGMSCPDDPQANAPNLLLETDAVTVGGNPRVGSPTQPVFKAKEDATFQIKAVVSFDSAIFEGPPADTATLSVIASGMTRTFPAPAGTVLAGPDFAPLTADGFHNPYTFTELPQLGDHYVNFSDNLRVTSVQVLDANGNPIQFCAVRIGLADRCATTAPDLTTVDLSDIANCPELKRHAVSLTPAHETPASDVTPLEWIVYFATPNGLPDINCHPNVPAQGAKLSLSFQLKVK